MRTKIFMTRHPENNNLQLYFGKFFQGLPVQHQSAPLVEEYLTRTLFVIHRALQQYSRVFAFRVDLRFPANQFLLDSETNKPIERFLASFKAKIRHNRNIRLKTFEYAHDTTVRYIWCREIGQNGLPHYHLALLLNKDAFCALGQFKMERNNIYNRLIEAWASALQLTVEDSIGLVHIPKKHCYWLSKDDIDEFRDFFYRVSYLCKAETKHFGDGVHSFGTSRI